jgi:hypothetical protein
MSKYVDNSEKLNYDGIRTYVRIADHERSIKKMTETKMELIKLILENDNPEQAVLIANAIILDILKQNESPEEQTAACL